MAKTGVAEGRAPHEESPRRLALPTSLSSVVASAKQYAEKLEATLEGMERLNQCVPAEAGRRGEAADRKRTEARLVQLYLCDLHEGRIPDTKPADRVWAGIAALRYWEKAGSALSHPLQRQAHALIDLTLQTGRHEDSASATLLGLAPSLRPFLRGLANYAVEDSSWDDVVVNLYRRGLEIMKTEGATRLPLAAVVMERVTGELTKFLSNYLQHGKNGEVKRSLANAAPVILATVWQGIQEKQASGPNLTVVATAALTEKIGPAFLSLLTEVDGDAAGKTFSSFSLSALRRLVAAAVRLVHEFPHFFLELSDPLSAWWRQLLVDLSRPAKEGQPVVEPGLLAEAACQMLESGLEDLPLLARHPASKEFFFVITLRALLEVITEPRPTGELRARGAFSSSDTALLIGAVIAAWRSHPEWLLKRPGYQERAATLLPLLVHALLEFDQGSLKALARSGRLDGLLAAVLVSGMSGKFSAFNAGKISSLVALIYPEVLGVGSAGLGQLLQQGRLTDLLNAVAASKVGDKVLGENEEAMRQGARSIALVAHDLRGGTMPAMPELVERLNKGK